MTSTVTGLPDRYRPLDQVGGDEPTPTGVIRSWRAKDRVLNRDVAIRVHTPGGPAAHAWIARALTAGGLATPALAMVYDAAEGSEDVGADGPAPGSAAYVVNEWIDGETLADRLQRGPLPEREARTIIRRLAEGVAEAHRVGLAVGGLTPEHVVLRPNGLVGLRAVPAATGTVQGDITALGALLEACLGGAQAVEAAGRGPRRGVGVPPDLAALVRRARSTEPGQGLSSVAAMVSLLNERPRTGPSSLPSALDRGDSENWLRRLRAQQDGGAPATQQADLPAPPADPEPPAPTVSVDAPVRLDPHTFPPVPLPVRPVPQTGYADSAAEPWTSTSDDLDAVLRDEGWSDAGYRSERYSDTGSADLPETEEPGARRRLAFIGVSVLALAVVIALAWWIGTNVLTVADSVDEVPGSTPPAGSSASAPSSSAAAQPGAPIAIVSADVFDPEGDGQPENNGDVPLSYDNDPSTSWSTLEYRGSPAFGNLKDGVGIMYDLGSDQNIAGVTLTTSTPGIKVEVRTGEDPDGNLDSYAVGATGTVDGTTDLTFDKPAKGRFLLVWVTSLVTSEGGFQGDLAEVVVHAAR